MAKSWFAKGVSVRVKCGLFEAGGDLARCNDTDGRLMRAIKGNELCARVSQLGVGGKKHVQSKCVACSRRQRQREEGRQSEESTQQEQMVNPRVKHAVNTVWME